MKKLLPLVVLAAAGAALLLGSGSCQSRIPRRDPSGEVFPTVKGESLTGKAWTLPADLAGEPTLLLVGYVQDAQFDADRWILGLMQAGSDLRLLEVPTIPGLIPTFLGDTIDAGMRKGIPEEDQGVVVTIYGDEAARIAEFTGTERPRNMRALLLDGEGRVVWFHDEGFSPRELMELVEEARSLGAVRSAAEEGN